MNTRQRLLAFVMVCVLSQAHAQTYNYFAPGGALSCTGQCKTQTVHLDSGAFIAGNMALANLPSINSSTVLGNYSGSTGSPTALNPLALANMQAAVISALVVASSAITLSGTQTIDGVSVGGGQTVLVTAQATSSQNGIYISASGAWTRAANFPAGYVIAQNCDLNVLIARGTLNQGTSYHLATTGGPITIGTTAQTWGISILRLATTALAGVVTVSSNGAAVAAVQTGTAANDCAFFFDTAGSLEDGGTPSGDVGPCVVSDVNGHPLLDATGALPTVTGTGCSKVAGSTDNRGSITATGIDTCTLTFGSAFTNAPFCGIGNIGATVVANLTGQPTTAHAIFATTAAGSFDYVCF